MQSKQKSVILCRPGNISPPPYLFISFLWFFLTSFLYNRMINQFINDFIIHALLKKTPKNPTTPKKATEHNSDLNSFVSIKLLLNFLLLVLVLFNILAEFWFRKLYWYLLCIEQKDACFLACWEVLFAFLISLCLHLQSLQKMAGHRKRKAPLTPLQLALLPVRRLK